MREIKFRTWDRDRKTMLNTEEFELSWLPNGFLLVEGDDRVGEDSDDRYMLMQYTGLKDMNGKEIYEGDIVKYYTIENGEKGIGKIEWNDCSCFFAFMLVKANGDSQVLGCPIDIEVIGNIYENKELLEEK